MIVCQGCQKKPATVHLTEIHQGTKEELHFCEECAREKGVGFKSQAAVAELLKSLLEGAAEKELPPDVARLKCPLCGLRFRDFKASGRLGCPNDYEVFAKALRPLLERIHGSAVHVGKSPRAAGPDDARARDLHQLQIALRHAVEKEEYEKAAGLRDRIEGLRGPPGKAGNG